MLLWDIKYGTRKWKIRISELLYSYRQEQKHNHQTSRNHNLGEYGKLEHRFWPFLQSTEHTRGTEPLLHSSPQHYFLSRCNICFQLSKNHAILASYHLCPLCKLQFEYGHLEGELYMILSHSSHHSTPAFDSSNRSPHREHCSRTRKVLAMTRLRSVKIS